jgi:hypothetical protein
VRPDFLSLEVAVPAGLAGSPPDALGNLDRRLVPARLVLGPGSLHRLDAKPVLAFSRWAESPANVRAPELPAVAVAPVLKPAARHAIEV